MRKVFSPAFIATLLALVYCLWVVATASDSLALVTLGEAWVPTELQQSSYTKEGYDGQFSYLLARYGWESTPYIDNAPYRAQRILLPVMARTLSFGQVDWLPWIMLAINLGALFMGTWALEQLLILKRQNRWIALGFGLSLGMLGSVRLIVTEPLAYALIVLAILQIEKERVYLGVFLIGISALAKEMTLIFALAYGVWWLWQRDWRNVLIGGLLMGVPALLWQVVLLNQFGKLGIGSGGALATPFEIIPLMGFFRLLTDGSLEVFLALGGIVFMFAVLPALWGLWVCLRDKSWSIWTAILFFNALLMLFVPFSTYREILGILRFIVGLQIAVILYAAHNRLRRPLMYSTLWAFTTLFVIFSDVGTL